MSGSDEVSNPFASPDPSVPAVPLARQPEQLPPPPWAAPQFGLPDPPPPYGQVPLSVLPHPAPQEVPTFGYGRVVEGRRVESPWPGAPLQAIDAAIAGRALIRPRWGITGSVVSLVLAVIVTNVVGIAYAISAPDRYPYTVILLFLTLATEWLFLGGWPLLASWVRGNGPRIDFGFSLSWRDIGPGLAGGLSTLIVAVVIGVITAAIFGSFTSNAGQAAGELSKHHAVQTLFLLLGVFVAPVFEELAFRGLLWSALAKRGLNPWWCTVITAVAFAAVHLEPIRFALLAGAGLVLGLLRQVTGRVGPSLIAHMTLNAVAFFGASGVLLLHW